MATSLDHDLTLRDQEQTADMLTDIATIIAVALKEQSDELVRFDNDVRTERDGNAILVDVPYALSRVSVTRYDRYPDQIAKLALEEVGLKLLAASRATENVWRDMQRVEKS